MKKLLIIGILLLVLGIGLLVYGLYEDSLYMDGLSSLPVGDIDALLGLGVLSILVAIVLMLIHFIMKKMRKKHENTGTSKVSAVGARITRYLSKSAVKTDRDGNIVIKRTLLGNLSFVLLCLVFVAGGLFIMQQDETATTIIGIIAIVFFGGGGLMYVILMIRKPIAIISDKGITVPHGWGENLAAWENIVKIEVMEQVIESTVVTTSVATNTRTKQKYIGIFVFDRREIKGAGTKSQAITKMVTGWESVPALLINLNFSFLNVEYIAGVLQELHDKYKNV